VAIAFSTASDLGNVDSATSFSPAFTVPSVTDGLLLIGILGDQPSQGNNDDIETVSWGSQSATLIAKVIDENVGGPRFNYLYAVVGPTAGASNITVTCANAHNISIEAAVYSGVSQTGFPDNFTTNLGTGPGNISTSLTPVANDCWIAMWGASFDNDEAPIAVSGCVLRSAGVDFGDSAFFDTNGPISPPASTTLTWGYGDDNGNIPSSILVSFAPAASSPTTVNIAALSGARSTGRNAPALATSISARSAARSTGRALATTGVMVSLAARSVARSTGRALVNTGTMVSLAARSTARSTGRVVGSFATSISARSTARSVGRAAPGLSVSFAARSVARSTGRALVTTGTILSLAARSTARSTGRAALGSSVSITARSVARSTGQVAISTGGQVFLAARSVARSTGRAAAALGTSLAARSTARGTATARPAPALQVAARSVARATGRTRPALVAAIGGFSGARSTGAAFLRALLSLAGFSAARSTGQLQPTVGGGTVLLISAGSFARSTGGAQVFAGQHLILVGDDIAVPIQLFFDDIRL
jgi:hypothetical protein